MKTLAETKKFRSANYIARTYLLPTTGFIVTKVCAFGKAIFFFCAFLLAKLNRNERKFRSEVKGKLRRWISLSRIAVDFILFHICFSSF